MRDRRQFPKSALLAVSSKLPVVNREYELNIDRKATFLTIQADMRDRRQFPKSALLAVSSKLQVVIRE
jgi:hypothetical protein